MPTRTEVIQALRARDLFRRDDMGFIMDYLEQTAFNQSDQTARDNVVLGWSDVEEYTEKDLERIYDYVSVLGTPAVSFAVFKQGLRDRDFMSLRLVNYVLDLIDAATYTPPLPPGSPLVWWDFTDISQLFQDTANSTPVTADGQDVNSVDDKGSLGVTLATNHNGTPNPPRFTVNVNGQFSGLRYDGANTEGLTSDDYDMSRVVAMMAIWSRTAPAGTNGSVLSGPSQDTYLRVINNIINVQAISVGTKASQVESGTPGAAIYGAWSNGENNSGEVSLNTVAGSDLKTGISPSNPAAAPSGVGCDEGGASGFADCEVLEVVVWDDVVSSKPTPAQMEQYAIDKHGVAWA